MQDPKKEKAVLLTVITPQKKHPESFSSESEKRGMHRSVGDGSRPPAHL